MIPGTLTHNRVMVTVKIWGATLWGQVLAAQSWSAAAVSGVLRWVP